MEYRIIMPGVEIRKLHEFMILNSENKFLKEKLQGLESAIENAGKKDNMYSLRRQAAATHAWWFTAYSQVSETAKELLQRDCICVELLVDLDILADLRESFFYGGKCGIRDGHAFEELLRHKAEQLNFKVVTLPSSG